MFTFDQLQIFVAVAEELHFGRAAHRLNMTQPPLSRQVQSLERQLNTELFDRSTRAVKLTSPGQAFLVEARRILALANNAAQSVERASAGFTGRVHIGFTAIAGHAHLPPILRRAAQELPDVDLVLHEMVTTDQLEGLSSGAIDLGLGRPSSADPELEYRRLPPENLRLALPGRSELLQGAGQPPKLSLSAMHNQDFLMYSPDDARYLHDLMTTIFRVHNIVPRYVQYITQVHTMLGLVDAGLGSAIVPESAMTWASTDVVFAEVDQLAGFHTEASLLWRRESTNPALRRLLLEVAAEYHPAG